VRRARKHLIIAATLGFTVLGCGKRASDDVVPDETADPEGIVSGENPIGGGGVGGVGVVVAGAGGKGGRSRGGKGGGEPPNTPPELVTNAVVPFQSATSGNLISGDLHLRVRDADGDALTLKLVEAPTHGSLTVAGVALTVGQRFSASALDSEAVAYANVDGSADSFVVSVADGRGGTIERVVVALERATSASPVVTASAASRTLREWYPALAADAGVTIADADSPTLDGGSLVVKITRLAGQADELRLVHAGTGAGEVGVAGAVVSFEGVDVATMSGGTAGEPLRFALNGAATPAAVQAISRRVTYRNAKARPAEDERALIFILDDGQGGVGFASIATRTVANKLVHHWKFDDAAGSTAALDSVTGLRNGLLVNVTDANAAWTTGRTGGALRLDRAAEQYVEGTDPTGGTDHPSVRDLPGFTVSMWVKPARASNGQILFWQGDTGGNGWGSFQHEFHMHLNRYSGTADDGKVGLFFGEREIDGLHYEATGAGGAPVFTTTSWLHVVGIVADAPDTGKVSVRLFVDGVEVTTRPNGPTEVDAASVQGLRTNWLAKLRLGAPAAAGRSFDGLLDDVRVFNFPLSTAEVAALP
jgi:hypothetical protein